MKSTTIIIACALFLLICGRPAAADNTLKLPADYASFYLPSDDVSYVEFYYCLYRHQLGFVGSDKNDHRYAGILMTATVYDQDGNPLDSASTYFLSQAKDQAAQDRTDVRLFDYLPMKLAPGHYRVDLVAIDDVSKETGKTSLLVSVPDYSEPRLSSSDLELAYDIRDAEEGTDEGLNPRLIKEERLIIPNPTGVYQPDIDSVMYVYSELYGLTPGEGQNGKFIVEYLVKDPQGNLIHNFGQHQYDKPGESAVVVNVLDIHTLDPGQYHLILEAEDPASGQKTIASKRFSLHNPETGVVAATTNDDVELMTDIAWFHLSEAEKMQIGQLNDAGKVNMIRQFWRDKDDDPSTPENPVYDEAVKRFAYANEHFSTSPEQNNGWRTDRGRIYITYGPYDEREEEVMGQKSYPYIIWTYHQLEGGCIFVFVNDFVAGAVDYRLVHSTHPREKYDPKWQSILEEYDSQDDRWLDPGDQEF